MDKVDFQTVSVIFNIALLMTQLYTTAKIAELKVYIHEKFVTKEDAAAFVKRN